MCNYVPLSHCYPCEFVPSTLYIRLFYVTSIVVTFPLSMKTVVTAYCLCLSKIHYSPYEWLA